MLYLLLFDLLKAGKETIFELIFSLMEKKQLSIVSRKNINFLFSKNKIIRLFSCSPEYCVLY